MHESTIKEILDRHEVKNSESLAKALSEILSLAIPSTRQIQHDIDRQDAMKRRMRGDF